MSNIEILIKVGDNQYYLDVDQDTGMSITYLISSITDLSTTKSSYTKTLKLKSTKNNDIAFGYISRIDSDGTLYNPNTKSKVYILVDSVVVLEGYIQFKVVNNDTTNNISYYDCVIYGDNFGFLNKISDKYITDIDFSEYDHTFNKVNIINSWSNNSDSGYYYGLIDGGNDWDYKDINGYSYSVGTVSGGGQVTRFVNELKCKDFKTAIYTKTIVDKIFSDAGFTYQSNFFNSQKFKNLLTPFNGSVIPTSTNYIYDNSFAVGRNNFLGPTLSSFSDTALVSVNGNKQSERYSHRIDFNDKLSPYSDPLNSYQSGFSATSSYWRNITGITLSTGFVINLDIDAQWASPTPKDTNNQVDVKTYSVPARPGYKDYQDYIQVFRSMNPLTGAVDSNFDVDGSQRYACPIFNSSTKLDLWGPQTERTDLGVFTSNGLTSSTTNFKLTRYTTDILNGTTASQFIAARPNEKFKLVLTRVFSGYQNGTTGFKSITALTLVNEGSYLALNIDRAIFTGAPIDFNGVLPRKMKQYDYLSNIIKMFNLFIEPSKDVQNCLIIEPRDDYYASGDIVDWRDKLDISQDIKQNVLAETQKRYTTLTYKNDSDFYNSDYTQKTNNIFGEYDFKSLNEFANDSAKIEIGFSPTPISNLRDAPGIILPSIYKESNGNTVARFDFNTRILTRSTAGTVSSGSNIIQFEGSRLSYYPYVGHIDHPFQPTYDINFGEVTQIYNGGNFGWDSYSIPVVDDNLFNTYYSKMFYEYSNPSSRIVTVSLYLDPIDIYKFRFNDNILLTINGSDQYFKILKISGYDPTKKRPTTVELLKTFYVTIPKDKNSDTGSIATANGESNSEQTPPIYVPPYTPVLTGFSSGNNNNIRDKRTLVLGDNNNVGNGGIVLGNNSIVSGSNIISSGDGNTIQDSNGVISVGSGNSIVNSSTTLVVGEGNDVQSSSIVFGSGNIVPADITNSFVIGNNVTATESNTIYIGGTGSNIVISGTISQENIKVGLNEIGFGTGTGITSSVNLQFDSTNENLISGDGLLLNSTKSLILGGQTHFIGTSSNSSIVGGYVNNLENSNNSLVFGYLNKLNGINSNILGSYNSLITEGRYSSILGGQLNQITNDHPTYFTSNLNNIIGGDNNKITSTLYNTYTQEIKNSLIIGGDNNTIDCEATEASGGGSHNINSVILSGQGSYIGGYVVGSGGVFLNNIKNTIIISASGSSAGGVLDSGIILGGFSNNLNNGNQNTIINGGLNNIKSSNFSSTISSKSTNLYFSNSSGIILNVGSSLGHSNNTTIIGGSTHSSFYSHKSSVLGGEQNTLFKSGNSVILGGEQNTLSSNPTNKSNSSIIGGGSSVIYNSINSSILGGTTNNLLNSQFSSILGGTTNFMGTSSNSSIVGGDSNQILNTFYSDNVSIIGGNANKIKTGSNSIIIGGSVNYINTSYNSITGGLFNELNQASHQSIVTGSYNTLEKSENSAIIGGNGNIITTAVGSISNSVILGGSSLSLTASNTVMVPTLKINSVVSSTSSQFLVWGPTKNVEYVNQTDLSYLEKTYSEITTLIGSNGLIPGVMYKISDRGDLGLFHIAISTNELSKTGQRLMLCPTNYTPGVYGGIYQKGVWYPGMTASTNQLAIWGGQVWKNNAGVSGTASTILALDSNWTLVDKTTYSNGEYEQKQFNIIYDVDNDWIQKQWDGYGNEVGVDNIFNMNYNLVAGAPYFVKYNPCDITDWNLSKVLHNDSFIGITYSCFTNNICPYGVFNNTKTPSITGVFTEIEIRENRCSRIWSNLSAGILNNNIVFDISNNVYSGILYNVVSLQIINNIDGLSDVIWYNTNNGNIANNTGGGDIQDAIVNK